MRRHVKLRGAAGSGSAAVTWTVSPVWSSEDIPLPGLWCGVSGLAHALTTWRQTTRLYVEHFDLDRSYRNGSVTIPLGSGLLQKLRRRRTIAIWEQNGSE